MNATNHPTDQAFLDDIRGRLAEAETAYVTTLESLTPDQLTWKPDPKSWSVTEVVDHILITGSAYESRLEGAIARAQKAGRGRPLKYGWLARMFLKLINDDERRVKAPGTFAPAQSEHDPALVGRFRDYQQTFAKQVDAARELNLNVKFGTPVSSLLRFRIGEAFDILTAHQLRHVRQIERLRAHDAFPA